MSYNIDLCMAPHRCKVHMHTHAHIHAHTSTHTHTRHTCRFMSVNLVIVATLLFNWCDCLLHFSYHTTCVLCAHIQTHTHTLVQLVLQYINAMCINGLDNWSVNIRTYICTSS